MKNYPFSRLSAPANVLVMPGLQSANLSAKLLRDLGGDAIIGPMLVGMEKSVQLATMGSSASELVTLAVIAAGGIVSLRTIYRSHVHEQVRKLTRLNTSHYCSSRIPYSA